MATEVQMFRKSLAETIGRDYVWVPAGDKTKHFDTLLIVHQYAGELFLLFVSAAGSALWRQIKARAVEMGQRLGTQTWVQIETWIAALIAVKPTLDEKTQVAEMEVATNTMVALGKTLAGAYLQDFLDAGKAAMLEKLQRDNFPPDKAARIATEFTDAVRKRIEQTDTASRVASV